MVSQQDRKQRRRRTCSSAITTRNAMQACVCLISWQVSITDCKSNTINFGSSSSRPFLGGSSGSGWRGLLFGGRSNTLHHNINALENDDEKHIGRPWAFLGWRGGSSSSTGNDSSGGGAGGGGAGGGNGANGGAAGYPYYRHPQQYQQQQQQRQPYNQEPPLPPDLPADLDDEVNSYPPRGQQQHIQQTTAASSYPPSPYSSPPRNPYQNSNQYPPSQSHQQQQQQQHHGYPEPSLPPLPPNMGGPSVPPEQQRQPMMPPSYDTTDESMMLMMNNKMDLDDDPNEREAFPWDIENDNGNSARNDPSGFDLKQFNKDYIMKGLAQLYKKKILPLERSSRYAHFHSPELSRADFDAPPSVLLLGPFSVGKTSFIKYLLGRDFPGIRVGPEPTTDRFTAVLWGEEDKIIPGAALCAQNYRPFQGLSPFGNNFLSRLEGVELNSNVLLNVTLIDTPGILSGKKQRDRNYDYEAVMKWFAERADLIIIMFDAHKLDISDELKRVIEMMIPHNDKIRIVLNKADSISTQQLMRVYGALMWNLGKVMNTPEVCRVYMGSFWDHPLQFSEQAPLLQQEERDLMDDIMKLPQQAVMRRINELIKRARLVTVHAYIIHYLRKQMPYNPWAKRDKQRRLIARLESEFQACARRYGLPKGDFPDVEPMRRALYEVKDLTDIPKLDKKLIKDIDKVYSVDIHDLLERAKNQ